MLSFFKFLFLKNFGGTLVQFGSESDITALLKGLGNLWLAATGGYNAR